MSHATLLAPVFAQVVLTFFLLFWMGRERYAAVFRKEVDVEDVVYGDGKWPKKTRQVAASFHNQLEMPPLFYLVSVLALVTEAAGPVFVALAWAFVISRIGHAAVHVTSNDVKLRGPAYIVGIFILMAMWVILAYGLVTAPAAA
ncbi:MAG: MAPEG family protein [Salinarimonas sp.]|nr:MAPEG family protein [Salinarimonas sp.]